MAEDASRYNAPSATYVGNNRLLVKSVIEELIYLVPADDLLIVPRFATSGIFESDVTNFILQQVKPTDYCCDVGANFGYYTCMLGRKAAKGRVIGLEADPNVSKLTRDNVAINWLEGNTHVKNLAASDREANLTLYRRNKRSGNTSIIHLDDDSLAMMNEAPSEAFEVKSTTISEIVRLDFDNRIDFIKIDVEGAEPLVIRGLGDSLTNNPNVKIVMEWSPSQISAAGFSIQEFVREMEGLDLKFAILDYDGSYRDLAGSDLINTSYGNIFLRTKGCSA